MVRAQYRLRSLLCTTAALASAIWLFACTPTLVSACAFFIMSIGLPSIIAARALNCAPEWRAAWIGSLVPATAAMLVYICSLSVHVPSYTFDGSAVKLLLLRLRQTQGFQREVIGAIWLVVPLILVIAGAAWRVPVISRKNHCAPEE